VVARHTGGRRVERPELLSRQVPSTGSPAPPISCAGRFQPRITVEPRGTETPDEAGLVALRAVAAELGTHLCRLVVLWVEKECTL
jgi:hypothetical protein